MTALRVLKTELARTGYGPTTVLSDYVFPDVMASAASERRAALAAFTQAPPSYRNAAIGVVEDTGEVDAAELISRYRALGAPLLFLLSKKDVSAWQVRAEGPARFLTRVPIEGLQSLFAENRDRWSPLAIQRAKSIGLVDHTYQLDFVDVGLLPAIEGETHSKLSRLLDETLASVVRAPRRREAALDERTLFRITFRLLAAKVLQDRGHALSTRWDVEDLASVLDGISTYYGLPPVLEERGTILAAFEPAWAQLRRGLNFRNISADDLAFVYENTLVTPETRKHFGTHSTPRPVAEYIVSRMELWRHEPSEIKVYEPFAGAGIFLVAALRHLRELLPTDWTDKQRHEFLVQRIGGDELDAFACEVARLSLILADYPNANGWRVDEANLFVDERLSRRLRAANVILCNPPFESFTQAERARYPEAAATSHSKPILALETTLHARPLALGFVLPEPLLSGSQYAGVRRLLEAGYRNIELVSLPDRIFRASDIRSAAVIAHGLRPQKGLQPPSVLRATVVSGRDRERFLSTGQVSRSQELHRAFGTPTGELWIEDLHDVWKYLQDYPTLGSTAYVHKGMEWNQGQRSAVRAEASPGFARGVLDANAVRAYSIVRTEWLDVRAKRIRRSGDLPWAEPKVLMNAARLSRGPWCVAASMDMTGLVASQQLFGVWPRNNRAPVTLRKLCAILNGPLANAYLASHAPPDRIRVSHVSAVPIPRNFPEAVERLVDEYQALLRHPSPLKDAASLLNQIDAELLRAYDLPPRLERALLEYFRGAERPTHIHPWSHWFPDDFNPAIPLHEFISEEFVHTRSSWPLQVFRPLPLAEAIALHEVLE